MFQKDGGFEIERQKGPVARFPFSLFVDTAILLYLVPESLDCVANFVIAFRLIAVVRHSRAWDGDGLDTFSRGFVFARTSATRMMTLRKLHER